MKETQDRLDQREADLEKAKIKIGQQSTQLAVSNEKIRQLKQNNTRSKFQSLLVSLIFILGGGLGSVGYNLITQTTPNSLGYFLVVMAIVTEIIATSISAGGGKQ